MKIIRILFLIIILILPLIASDKTSSLKQVVGRIIYYSDNMIEIKKGSIEYLLYFDDTSSLKHGNSSVTIKEIALCQKVEITFVNIKNKKIIKQLEILKDSDCISK